MWKRPDVIALTEWVKFDAHAEWRKWIENLDTQQTMTMAFISVLVTIGNVRLDM